MKKSSVFLLCAAFIVTGATLFYTWTNWSGARELRAALAQLEAKKESIRMEDFVPPPIPDDQNVAMAPIFQEFFASGHNFRQGKLALPWKNLGAQPAGESRLVHIAKNLDPQFSGDEAAAGRAVLESLGQFSPVLEEVREALQRPQVNWPVDYSKGFEAPLEYVYPIMTAAQILRERSRAELAVGSSDKAAQDTLTLLALAGVSVPPQLLICELVRNSILRMACDVISDGLCRGAWSDRELAAFAGGLTNQSLLRQLADSLRMERAMSQQWNWFDPKTLILLSSVSTYGGASPVALRLFCQLRPAGWVSRDRALTLLLTQRGIDALGDGKSVSPTEVRNIESLLKNTSKWYRMTIPFTYRYLPSIPSSIQTVCFTQTLLECTRTACAVELYRLANSRLPERLDDLDPAFLAEVPKDPLTGAALVYKPSPDGSFVIYGVGWNETDDGGSLHSPTSKNPQKQLDWGLSIDSLQTKGPAL